MTLPPSLTAVVLFAGQPPEPAAITDAIHGRRGESTVQLLLIHPPFPVLDIYLADPSQPLAEDERLAVASGMSGLLLRAAEPAAPETSLRAYARIIVTLVGLGGLGVILPAALKVIGRRQVLALAPLLQTPEGLTALFLHRHVIQDSATVWYHTHGMEQFGLPDLESRSVLADARMTQQLVEGAVAYLRAGGEGLRAGGVVEALLPFGSMIFRVACGRSLADHHYGAYGALELELLS